MLNQKPVSFNVFILAVVFLSIFLVTNNCAIAQNRGERIKEILQRRQNNPPKADPEQQEIVVGNLHRTYIVHLPPNYDKKQKLPLVIALHGGGGNAANMAKMTGFSEKADKENFIVVYPNGSGGMQNILLTWNAGGCCSYAVENKIDDVGFMRALIDKLVADYGVDEKRVYATGFSNGAMLAYRLGAELSDKLAAVAPVSGAIFDSTRTPTGKLPILILHGDADTAVPFDGGYSNRGIVKSAQNEADKPVRFTVNLWAKNNGCQTEPGKTQTGNIIKEIYQGCAANNDVVLYIIGHGQHAWAGGQKGREAADTPSTEISATDVIWDFFKAHKKN